MEEILALLRAGDSRVAIILAKAKKVIIDHRECHRGCDVGSVIHCDLFYDMIEEMFATEQAAIQQERMLMPCGHPKACRPNMASQCSACVSEARIIEKMKAQQPR